MISNAVELSRPIRLQRQVIWTEVKYWNAFAASKPIDYEELDRTNTRRAAKIVLAWYSGAGISVQTARDSIKMLISSMTLNDEPLFVKPHEDYLPQSAYNAATILNELVFTNAKDVTWFETVNTALEGYDPSLMIKLSWIYCNDANVERLQGTGER